MPLSEEDQRALQGMEEQLKGDPALARTFSKGMDEQLMAGPRHRLRWAATAFAVGFALLLGTFTISAAVGLAGYVIMLAAAYAAQGGLKELLARARSVREARAPRSPSEGPLARLRRHFGRS